MRPIGTSPSSSDVGDQPSVIHNVVTGTLLWRPHCWAWPVVVSREKVATNTGLLWIVINGLAVCELKYFVTMKDWLT